MPKSNAEKQRDHYRRMKERGFVKVCVYVPPEDRAEIQKMAENFRNSVENSVKK